MKVKKLLFTFFLIYPIVLLSQNIEEIKLFSEILNQNRNFLIYKPEETYYSASKRFEVIYVFDAQSREVFDFIHSSIKFIDPNLDFIIVGIQSPYLEIGNHAYGRNDDMLPKALNDETKRKFFNENTNGNADAFKEHIEKELFPLIENNYRTLPLRVAIGHSNSATFLSYCFLKKPDMFDAYILQSPNLAYDKEQLVKRFEEFNFEDIENKKFLFFSNGNESSDSGWKGWRSAREKIYNVLRNQKNKNIH